MKKKIDGMDRRRFIGGGAAGALLVASPLWLAGCATARQYEQAEHMAARLAIGDEWMYEELNGYNRERQAGIRYVVERADPPRLRIEVDGKPLSSLRSGQFEDYAAPWVVSRDTVYDRDNRYDAMVPQVVSALRLKGRVHAFEAQLARAHTRKKLKFTLPGPMTIVDTVADRFYGDRVKMAFAFAELLNQEALALQADGVDIIQFDEPAFNVYMKDAADWGVQALERAAQGLTCTTAVHICYGYGIKANTDWKSTLGDEWRQYETVFPALARSRIDQVSLECIHSHVPPDLMRLLAGKDVMVGVIDVASDVVETPEEVADTIGRALEFVPKERLFPCTNCGLAPMGRDVAWRKLQALAAGTRLAKERLAAA